MYDIQLITNDIVVMSNVRKFTSRVGVLKRLGKPKTRIRAHIHLEDNFKRCLTLKYFMILLPLITKQT